MVPNDAPPTTSTSPKTSPPSSEARSDQGSRVNVEQLTEATADVRGDYRYVLTRTWDSAAEPVVFVMLNPSTADATVDDRTVRRCIWFAKREGFGGIIVVNLYAYRATNPRVMFAAEDPVGPANDAIIAEHTRGRTVIAAWSYHAEPARTEQVLELLSEAAAVFVLGLTKHGHPRHPLYVRGEAPLAPWPQPTSRVS